MLLLASNPYKRKIGETRLWHEIEVWNKIVSNTSKYMYIHILRRDKY